MPIDIVLIYVSIRIRKRPHSDANLLPFRARICGVEQESGCHIAESYFKIHPCEWTGIVERTWVRRG